ncbi:MAG: hypothetical protein SO119_08970 [Phascolarctobacterium sp.]|nr:hypothetical protein [Phascolarctobacterium sp.]
MKQLFNYCPVMGYEKQIAAYPGQLQGYLCDNHLDGVELNVYDTKPYPDDYRETAIGVHLKYWPMWLDFWQHNGKQPETNKLAASYAVQASNNEEWLDIICQNLRVALSYEPEYLVWHVSDCNLEEMFTRKYVHTDEEVIDATIAIVNEIVGMLPEHTYLLFENLWWPGLTFRKPCLAEKLLVGVKFSHVGFMLDTGHLMNSNWELTSEAEGIKFVMDTVRSLGEIGKYIKGMHLNCSLSGNFQRAHLGPMPKVNDLGELINFVSNLDQHRPFQKESLKPLLELVQPEYLNHELFFNTMEHMSGLLRQQQALL